MLAAAVTTPLSFAGAAAAPLARASAPAMSALPELSKKLKCALAPCARRLGACCALLHSLLLQSPRRAASDAAPATNLTRAPPPAPQPGARRRE